MQDKISFLSRPKKWFPLGQCKKLPFVATDLSPMSVYRFAVIPEEIFRLLDIYPTTPVIATETLEKSISVWYNLPPDVPKTVKNLRVLGEGTTSVELEWHGQLLCQPASQPTTCPSHSPLHHPQVGNHGFEMDSKDDNQPRSFPQVYNALVVGNLEHVIQVLLSETKGKFKNGKVRSGFPREDLLCFSVKERVKSSRFSSHCAFLLSLLHFTGKRRAFL